MDWFLNTDMVKILITWHSFIGHLILKANYQAVNASKKRTNEFVFTSMRRVFVRFLEESLARKKTFRDYLTFSRFKKKSLLPLIKVR